MAETAATMASRRPHDRRGPMVPPTFPFHPPAIAPWVAVVEKAPASPPEVAAIATDCLLGVSVADAAWTDPDGGSS
jgi:hypothetical protein